MEDRGSQVTTDVSEHSDEALVRGSGSRPYRYERRRPDPIRYALHDRLGPALASLQLRLGLLEEEADERGFGRQQVTSLKREVAGMVEELDRIVHDELPKPLELGGLVRAAREACRHAESFGLVIDYQLSGRPVLLPRDAAELLYRAVLEGTANVVRHARARRCLVRLTFARAYVSVEVRDDGHCARPALGAAAASATSTVSAGGLGLASLWGAVRQLGGSVRLESLHTRGTRLVVKLPLEQHEPQTAQACAPLGPERPAGDDRA